MMSEPLLARQEIPVEVRDEIRRIADGLTEFAKLGGAQKDPVDGGIDLAMLLVSAHVDKGIPRALVKTAHLGLVAAREKQRNKDYKNDNYTPLMIVGLGMLSVGMETFQAMLPPGDPQPPPPSPFLESIGELLAMFADLRKDNKGVAPYEKLAMAMAFLDKAGKMPVVGRYMKPLANPAQSLLAPDTDQQDYMSNLLLAELGAARNDNPINVPKAFKSTCPAFSLDKGVQWSGSPNADDVFVCAVDMARETVVNNMRGAVDPLSAAGMAQNARTVVAGMKRETVFAKTSGDDTLSGISGLLEYRNGAFNKFDLILTYGLAGQFEVASKMSYTSQLLTIEQATSDSRDSGMLATLGLAKAGQQAVRQRYIRQSDQVYAGAGRRTGQLFQHDGRYRHGHAAWRGKHGQTGNCNLLQSVRVRSRFDGARACCGYTGGKSHAIVLCPWQRRAGYGHHHRCLSDGFRLRPVPRCADRSRHRRRGLGHRGLRPCRSARRCDLTRQRAVCLSG